MRARRVHARGARSDPPFQAHGVSGRSGRVRRTHRDRHFDAFGRCSRTASPYLQLQAAATRRRLREAGDFRLCRPDLGTDSGGAGERFCCVREFAPTIGPLQQHLPTGDRSWLGHRLATALGIAGIVVAGLAVFLAVGAFDRAWVGVLVAAFAGAVLLLVAAAVTGVETRAVAALVVPLLFVVLAFAWELSRF